MMFPVMRSGASIVACLCLAACADGGRAPPPNLEQGLGETVNHVVVTSSKITEVIHFRPGADEPESRQISDLNDFLARTDAGRGAAILIERSGEASDDDRAAILSGALARRGLRPTVRVAAIPVGDLRLTIERYVASVPGCPNWSKAPGNDLANTLPSDFGCATAENLAAMVADPHDLVEGRGLSPVSGDPAIAPLQRYRAGKVAPLIDPAAGAASPPVLAISTPATP